MPTALLYSILTLGFLTRLIPHVWDFTPVLALGLLAGAFLTGVRRFLVPLGLMIATDMILGFYPSILINWAAYAACIGIGAGLGQRFSAFRIGMSSLAAAVVFFVISNFGVWLADYPKTAEGFADCYLLALPFFRNSLMSTVIYGYLLIGGYVWAAQKASARQSSAG